MCTNLHLHVGEALLRPAAKLVGELLVGVSGEAAAAVDRNAAADLAQDTDQRSIE